MIFQVCILQSLSILVRKKKNATYHFVPFVHDTGVEGCGRKVSPEGIAAYESQLAAAQRLKDLGVKDLHTGANNILNLANVMIFLNGAVQAAMERKIKMKKVLDIKKRQKSAAATKQLPYFEKAYAKLDQQHKEMKKRQEIAK